MEFDGERAHVEELLKCFLVGTQNVSLGDQILQIGDLPMAWRDRVLAAQSAGRAWTAWSTERGPMVAWGKYDVEGSMRLKVHAMYIEWYLPPNEHHALWCRGDPKRPTEWTVGRGSLEQAR
jgi:hypothetical protein